MTAEELIDFEKDIVKHFEAGEIRAPIHLAGGNEQQLIHIFKNVKPNDWVFSTHRSHYHALLKGIPPELVKSEILKGHSISLQFPEYRFHTSAIVAGIVPIALGVAMTGDRVWCFVGDMASRTGIFYESIDYAEGNDLPITFIVENNGLSVETPTKEAWGKCISKVNKEKFYWYQRTYPHQGSGKWIIF